MSFTITRYRAADAESWYGFVRSSRNGTFLLERGFMDYHADRFEDHSLLLHDASGRLAAVMPANARDGELHSHAGLTYGGLVYGTRSGAAEAVAMLEAVRTYQHAQGIARLHYKTIPSIYHRQPAEDDRYALFRCEATLVRRDVLSVLAGGQRPGFQERRRRGVASARRAGVTVEESNQFQHFWPILEDNLQQRHGTAPVHSLAEIRMLHARYPDNIRLFCALLDRVPVAGVVVFETDRVAHVQYISAGAAGREVAALDAVFEHLLMDVFVDKPWFDFGISNEDQGRQLNLGLLQQKEGFGARTVVHDYYSIRSKEPA